MLSSLVPHPHYQPGPPSYKVVTCTDSLCDALHQDLGTTKHCAEAFQCDYTLTYADGSSIGVLMTDKFSLPMAKAPNDHPDLAIGYAHAMQHFMITAQWLFFLRLATFVCGFAQMWLWPGEECWEGNDCRWHPWSWTELGIAGLAAQEPKDHHKECHWPLPQYKRRRLPLFRGRERARFRCNLGPHGTKNTWVCTLAIAQCVFTCLWHAKLMEFFSVVRHQFQCLIPEFSAVIKHCIPFTF